MKTWAIILSIKNLDDNHYFLTQSESLDEAYKKCLSHMGIEWNQTACKSGQVYEQGNEKYMFMFKFDRAITV